MAAPLFTVKIGDGLGAHIGADEELFKGATITFTPNIKTGDMVLVDGALRTVPKVVKTLDADGKLNGNTGIQLLANDSSLGLDNPVQYKVSVTKARQQGYGQAVKEWVFDAGSAGEIVDLADVPPVVGTAAVAMKGPATMWVVVDEGPPRMWRQYVPETGQFMGEPVDYLPDVSAEVSSEIADQVPGAVANEVPPATADYISGLPFGFNSDGYPVINGIPTGGPPLDFLPGGVWNNIAGTDQVLESANIATGVARPTRLPSPPP